MKFDSPPYLDFQVPCPLPPPEAPLRPGASLPSRGPRVCSLPLFWERRRSVDFFLTDI